MTAGQVLEELIAVRESMRACESGEPDDDGDSMLSSSPSNCGAMLDAVIDLWRLRVKREENDAPSDERVPIGRVAL